MKINTQAGICLLLAILFILAAAHNTYAGEYQCSGSLATDMENIKRARSITQGTFVRFDKNTLKFEGHIERGTYAKYLEAIDGEVKAMIINSSGGDTYDGVRIGLDMAKRNIDVIVDGVAGSSAANYFSLRARAASAAVLSVFTVMPARLRRIARRLRGPFVLFRQRLVRAASKSRRHFKN